MQQHYRRNVRIIVDGTQGEVKPPSVLGRAVAIMVGAAALVVAFMISVVALAVAAVVVLIGVGYVWWKTRDLRRRLRENPPGGRVIDGDASRDQN
jgi:O-antigen/teichoic acid export membrane protein